MTEPPAALIRECLEQLRFADRVLGGAVSRLSKVAQDARRRGGGTYSQARRYSAVDGIPAIESAESEVWRAWSEACQALAGMGEATPPEPAEVRWHRRRLARLWALFTWGSEATRLLDGARDLRRHVREAFGRVKERHPEATEDVPALGRA